MDIWGPPIDTYIGHSSQTSDKRTLELSTIPDVPKVLSAIKELQGIKNVTFSTLEDIIKISCYPRLFNRLREPGIITACMTLIRSRCHKHELLTCTYGYLSLRVLCLVLEVCVARYLPGLADATEQNIWPCATSKCLADYIPRMVAFSCDTRSPFLLWEPSSGRERPRIFSFAGGLTDNDVRFLIDMLFSERKTLLYCCLNFGLPGISTLFVILWQFMASHSDRQLWTKLDILQLRNYLVSPEIDRPITRTLSKPFCVGPKADTVLSASVDRDDQLNLIKSFERNIHLVPPEDARDLTLWFQQAVWLGVGDYTHALTSIGLVRDLFAFIVGRYGYDQDYRMHCMHMAMILPRSVERLIRETSLQPPPQFSVTVRRILAISQVVGISGQSFLQGILYEVKQITSGTPGGPFLRGEKDAISASIHGIQLLVQTLRIAHKISDSILPTLDEQIHFDWSRTYLHFYTVLAQYDVKSRKFQHFYEAWRTLGQALEIEVQSSHICAYSRCPDPTAVPYVALLVCGSCQSAYYCSRACQHAEGNLDMPTSHRYHCTGMNTMVATGSVRRSHDNQST